MASHDDHEAEGIDAGEIEFAGQEEASGQEAEPGSQPDRLARKLEKAEERLLRVQAELDNFRKRSRRELEEALRYREIDLLRDLLPVHDNMLRAIEAAENSTDIKSLLNGFQMTAQQIEKLLESHGCKPIETDGAAFDPAVHDAVLQQAVPGVPAGQVVGVTNRGYCLHDRVVRPAQVIVAKESDS